MLSKKQNQWLTLSERFKLYGQKYGVSARQFFISLGFSHGTVSGWFSPSSLSLPQSKQRAKIIKILTNLGHDLHEEGLGWLLAGEEELTQWYKGIRAAELAVRLIYQLMQATKDLLRLQDSALRTLLRQKVPPADLQRLRVYLYTLAEGEESYQELQEMN